jgi:ketosteroid isomerase-like protein
VTSHAEDLAAVKQLGEDFAAAWHPFDPEALLALYTDDAAVMLSNEPPIMGKEQLRALYQSVAEYYAQMRSGEQEQGEQEQVELQQDEQEQPEVEVGGDLGYIRTAWTATSTPKAGDEPIKEHCHQVCIVRRQQDGSWKVSRLISIREFSTAIQGLHEIVNEKDAEIASQRRSSSPANSKRPTNPIFR